MLLLLLLLVLCFYLLITPKVLEILIIYGLMVNHYRGIHGFAIIANGRGMGVVQPGLRNISLEHQGMSTLVCLYPVMWSTQ
jgi:hypothetical protein